ncbi:MAG: Gfo/Idh/MocA family oxidoreductase [Chitinophagaceae bacterium]|nr:Gfo/Idh/MocA family oxidoreductase [Chitinophagaceae bacterium]
MPVYNRRNFIRNSSAILAGSLVLPLINRAQQYKGDVIRVGIIGAGSRGTGMAVLMNKIQGLQVVACCDVLPQNLDNCIKTAAPTAKAYTDYRKLLEDKSIDAVLIATPLFLHAPMAGAALEAGKHVYLEKAMAFSVDEVLQLTRTIRANPSLVFQLGYQYRYYGLYKKIKEIIQKNWLGKITHIESQYNRNSDWRNPVKDPTQERIINWRMYKEYCGGPLSELCSHQIDMINYLLDGHPFISCWYGWH